MTKAKHLWRYGLGVGLLTGVLDAGLVFAVDPASSPWLIAQVFFAWVAMGWAVIASESGLKPLAHCLLVTLFLSLPWYISEAIVPGEWMHLPPLVIQGIVNGLIFTVAKRQYVKKYAQASV